MRSGVRDFSHPVFARLLGPEGTRAKAGSGPLSGFLPYAVLAAIPIAFAFARQQFCASHGWGGKAPLWRQCSSDLVHSVQTAGLGRGLTAYLSGEISLNQPPVAGTVMSTVAGLFGGGSVLSTQRLFLLVWVLIALGCVLAMTWAARTIAQHPGANPLMMALAPVTAFTVLLSPDILGVTLATFGLWAWTRDRPVLSGLLLGLGVMARSYPLLLVVVVLLIAMREGRPAARDRLIYGVLGGLAGGALPLVGALDQLPRAVTSWWNAAPGVGSLWFLPTMVEAPLSPLIATTLAVVGWLVAAVLTAVLVLGSRQPPTVAAAALFAVAIVLITSKALPLQSSLWLVPLVALAGIRWRAVLIWSLAEAAHWVAFWLYVGGLGSSGRSLPGGWYLLFVLGRLVAIGYLAWQVWRESVTSGGETSDGAERGNMIIEGVTAPGGEANPGDPAQVDTLRAGRLVHADVAGVSEDFEVLGQGGRTQIQGVAQGDEGQGVDRA